MHEFFFPLFDPYFIHLPVSFYHLIALFASRECAIKTVGFSGPLTLTGYVQPFILFAHLFTRLNLFIFCLATNKSKYLEHRENERKKNENDCEWSV